MAQTVKLGNCFLYIGEEATVSDYAASGIAAHDEGCLYQAFCSASENAVDLGLDLSFDVRMDWAGIYLANGTSSCYCR